MNEKITDKLLSETASLVQICFSSIFVQYLSPGLYSVGLCCDTATVCNPFESFLICTGLHRICIVNNKDLQLGTFHKIMFQNIMSLYLKVHLDSGFTWRLLLLLNLRLKPCIMSVAVEVRTD